MATPTKCACARSYIYWGRITSVMERNGDQLLAELRGECAELSSELEKVVWPMRPLGNFVHAVCRLLAMTE